MAFPGTGKIWMNGKLVDWKDANDSHRLARHPLRQRRVRRRALLQHAARLGLLPPRRPHAPAVATPRRSTGWSRRSICAALTDAVLETIRANEFKACYIRPIVYRGYDALGVNPFPCPVDAAILLVGMGRLPRPGSAREGVDVRVSSWSRTAPNTFPALAKSVGQLRQLAADQDGSDRRRLQRRDRARHLRQPQRRQRPEPLPRPRRRHLHAAARPRRSCRASRATRSSRSPATSASRCSEEMLPREMLYIADEVFFVGTAAEVTPIRSVDKITIGDGRRGPITEALQQAFFDVDQRRGARPPRLADVRLPGRAAPAGRRRRRGGCGDRALSAESGRPACRRHARQRSAEDRRRQRRVRPAPQGRQLPDDARPRHAGRRVRGEAARPRGHRRDGAAIMSDRRSVEKFKEVAGSRPRLQRARPRPLPLQRLPAARHRRPGPARHPDADPDDRRARAAAGAEDRSPRKSAAWCSSPARPAAARARRSRR